MSLNEAGVVTIPILQVGRRGGRELLAPGHRKSPGVALDPMRKQPQALALSLPPHGRVWASLSSLGSGRVHACRTGQCDEAESAGDTVTPMQRLEIREHIFRRPTYTNSLILCAESWPYFG